LNSDEGLIKDVIKRTKTIQAFHESTISTNPRMPSHYIRPARRAAQLAAIRITECINNDASSDSDNPISPVTTIDSGIERARNGGYDSTVYVVKYLLEECDNCKNPEDRIEIASKMFDILNKNPKILICEPKFRTAVTDKINEVDNLIKKRKDAFAKAEYTKAIEMMKLSMRVHLNNSKMRNKIYEHLNGINTILNEYTMWMNSDTLKKSIGSINDTLNSIKAHPDYVLA
jgi:hypothetical protein